MDKRELKMKIRNELLKVQSARSTGSAQVTLRCPFCGDSQKDLTHAHFNVKLNLNDDEPVIFHCFRCDIGGVLTPAILRTFKINDLQMSSGLLSYNKETMSKLTKAMGLINNDLNFIIPMPKDDEKTEAKKRYIEERMGRKFDIDELVKLKTIFNLGDFLRANGIEKLTCNKDKAVMLHNDYVGFLTSKNEFINFRDITGTHKRYEKYSVYNNLDNTRKFYTIPTKVDLLSTDTITINIAEGVFDVLGLYNHIYDRYDKDMIYTAVCGAGYISVIKYFIQMGMFGNVDVNIYSDADRYPSYYQDLKKELGIWINNLNLYYNEKGKDYGVRKDQIKIIKKKIY